MPRRLSDYYKNEKNDSKWKDLLQKSKIELNEKVKRIAYKLLLKKEIEFTDQEIVDNFERFWSSKKNTFISKKGKTFALGNVAKAFVNEIRMKYGYSVNLMNIYGNFGSHLQSEFRIEWIKISHVEFIGSTIYKLFKEHLAERNTFLKNKEDLIDNVEQRLLREVIQTTNNGGLMRMQFLPNSIIFECGTLMRLYLTKATDILIQNHNQSSQKDIHNLTDTTKEIFLFFSAQIAIPNLEKAQQSFIDNMGISTKLDRERGNIK